MYPFLNKMSDHNKLHNPVYIGPGEWNTIHTLAAWANTPERKKIVIEQIKYLQSRFPCIECKGHFGNYIIAHPMEYTIDGPEDALFLWTVNFHNAVNHRLGKAKVSYEDAKSIYYADFFCFSKCDEETKTIKPTPKIVPKEYPGSIY